MAAFLKTANMSIAQGDARPVEVIVAQAANDYNKKVTGGKGFQINSGEKQALSNLFLVSARFRELPRAHCHKERSASSAVPTMVLASDFFTIGTRLVWLVQFTSQTRKIWWARIEVTAENGEFLA